MLIELYSSSPLDLLLDLQPHSASAYAITLQLDNQPSSSANQINSQLVFKSVLQLGLQFKYYIYMVFYKHFI